MNICVEIKDINDLTPTDAAEIMRRLSWPDSDSDSSIQKELRQRYVDVTPGPHPGMVLALVRWDSALVGWVGTRPWPEKFKGEPVMAQTIECFVAPEFRRRGIARLGLQTLIAAQKIDKAKPVAVYAAAVINVARSCGCKIVLLCDA